MRYVHMWILALAFALSAFAQPSSTVPKDPRWQTVGAAALAARPVTCTANRSVYICSGAGCGAGLEFHYCTATNVWTVGSSTPPSGGAVGGASAMTTVGAVPAVTASGVLGNSAARTIGAGANQLPAAAACSGCTMIVSDAASNSDCTVGSGAVAALCRSNGATWVALGSGALGTSPTITGAASLPTVGVANLLIADGTFATNTGWTEGAGWAIGTGVATHSTGNTAALSGTSTATGTGSIYRISFTLTVSVAGTGFTVSLGGVDSGNIYTTSGAKTCDIGLPGASGTLAFTPGAAGTFVGTIDDVVIYAITPSTAEVTLIPSDYVVHPITLRHGGESLSSLFLGYLAGQVNLGNGNMGFGFNTLHNNTSGIQNIAIGSNSMRLNTSGGQNVAFGSGTLYNNKTGSYNIAIGQEALEHNISGGANNAIGLDALYLNTTGNENTAQGGNALQNNTTGSGNTAIGAFALQNSTTSSYNLALGYDALRGNTIGHHNVAVGHSALRNNSDSNYATAVGASALNANTSGLYNVAVGANSVAAVTTAGGNTGIGTNALGNASGAENTAVGYYGGWYVYTGTNNVFVGKSASPPQYSTAIANAIGVGHTSIAMASNQAVFGNRSTTQTVLFGSVQLSSASEPTCMTATDLVIDAADNKKVTSASHNFVAADVGRKLQITAGTGFNAGTYWVISTASNAATLDDGGGAITVVGTVGSTGGTWSLNRGLIVPVESAAGSDDTLRSCSQNADGTYAWRTVANSKSAIVDAAPGGTVPARKDYTLVCQANLTSGTLTNIVVASNAATATCTAGGCGMINGQTAYVIGATSDTDLNKAYVVVSSGITDTTVTFTTANVTDGTYEVGSDAGMSFQGCLLNGASYTGNIAAATTIRPVLFSLTAGSKIIGNTVYWPAAWTGPGTLTGSVGATSGADDTFYAAASNLMAATSFLDTSSYKSKLHGSADNVVAALVANANFGDATLPILKLNGSATFSVTW